MENRFQLIEKEYKDLEKNLLKNGKLPFWGTDKGFFNGANCSDIFNLFKHIRLDRYKNFIDLGSGDGRVVLIASLFTKAAGIEVDPGLHAIAEENKSKLFAKRAEFFNKDFLNHDLNSYDLVFINPDKPFHRGLEDKLLKELNGHLLVFGPFFLPQNLKHYAGFFINRNYCSIYSNR